MEQYIPNVTDKDVERVILRDYSKIAKEVRDLLSQYGIESFQREIPRVRLAALKLGAGDLVQIRYQMESACCDYRDVISYAEYPSYSRKVFKGMPNAEKERIIESDKNQYLSWLHKE